MGRVIRHSLFKNGLETSFHIKLMLVFSTNFSVELGTIASRWSNRVVAILRKLEPNKSSFFRSCEHKMVRRIVIATFNPLQSFAIRCLIFFLAGIGTLYCVTFDVVVISG